MDINKLVKKFTKIYCVTTLNNERYFNIKEQENKLKINIEIKHPSNVSESRYSFNYEVLSLLKQHKNNKEDKILIFEDDFYTDLSNLDFLTKEDIKIILNGEYQILTLGSTYFKYNKITKNLVNTESFGYGHAVVFNMTYIDDKFIKEFELLVNKKQYNYDNILSKISKKFKKTIGLRESIFIQRDFVSQTKDVEPLFNPSFRYRRNFKINDFYETSSVYKKTEENVLTNDWGYEVEKTYVIFMTFNKKDINVEYPIRVRMTDYYSGSYSYNIFDNLYYNFWISFRNFTDYFFIELIDNNDKVIFRDNFNLLEIETIL